MSHLRPRCGAVAAFCVYASLMIASLAAADAGDAAWSTDFYTSGLDAPTRTALGFGGDLIVGGEFTALGDLDLAHVARFDGEAWHSLGDGFNGPVSSLSVYGGQLVACGDFTASGATLASHVAVWDGAAWGPLGEGVPYGHEAFLEYGGDLYVAGRRWDGNSWSIVLAPNLEIHAAVVFDGRLVVAGRFTEINGESIPYVAAWDGSAVADLYPGMDAPVTALAVHDGMLVAVRDADSGPAVVGWTGTAWENLGILANSFGTRVTALATAGELLYAARNHGDPINLITSADLVVWNGDVWTDLAQETGYVDLENLAAWNGGVAICGDYVNFGGVVARNIEVWYPEGAVALADVGLGTDGPVFDMDAGPEGLVIVGFFDYAGGSPSPGIVRKTVDGWEDLGAVPSWSVTHLDGFPVVQMDFTSDVPEHYVMRWTEGGWEHVPIFGYEVSWTGMELQGWNGWVYQAIPGTSSITRINVVQTESAATLSGGTASTLGLWNDRLLVGGTFTSVEGVPAACVASLGDEGWSAVGDGLAGDVLASADWNGALAVAGPLSIDGDDAQPRVALWDGDAWQPLGGGFDDVVRCLAVHAGQLFAGGVFHSVDGIEANGVARWDGRAWHPLGRGLDFPISGYRGVSTLASCDGDLWVGGVFSEAGGQPAANLCTWSDPTVAIEPGDGGTPPPTSLPAALRLAEPSPNPFNPAAEIRFELPEPARVTLTVHDLRGRRIATLASGDYVAGEHAATWRGTDDAGRPQSAGVYFVRLRAGMYSRTVKAVLVR